MEHNVFPPEGKRELVGAGGGGGPQARQRGGAGLEQQGASGEEQAKDGESEDVL